MPLGRSATLAVGCVTRGTYDEVEGERDRLREEKRRLEQRVNSSLFVRDRPMDASLHAFLTRSGKTKQAARDCLRFIEQSPAAMV